MHWVARSEFSLPLVALGIGTIYFIVAAGETEALERPTVLRTHSAQPFDVMQFLMPLLAGVLAGAWRACKPNQLATVGMATAAGASSSWLFLSVMMLGQYYQFNPVGYVFWWALTGAIFGAIGYGGWLLGRLLVRIASGRSLKTRHSHA